MDQGNQDTLISAAAPTTTNDAVDPEKLSKAIDVEEGEVETAAEKAAGQSGAKANGGGSQMDIEGKANTKNGDANDRDKSPKHKKKHKSSKKDDKEKQDESSDHKKSSKKKKKSEKDQKKRSPSREKKHRRSRSLSKKTKSNRKRSSSSSRSDSLPKDSRGHKKRSDSRSRRRRDDSSDRRRTSPKDSRRRTNRGDSKQKEARRSRSRSENRRKRSRSAKKTDRRREKSGERKSNANLDQKSSRRENGNRDDKQNKKESIIEEDINIDLNMDEENEEKIARERREQRKAMLQQYEKHTEPEAVESEETVTATRVAEAHKDLGQAEQASQNTNLNIPTTEQEKAIVSGSPTKQSQVSIEKDQKLLEVTKTDSSGLNLQRADSTNANGIENEPNKWLNPEFKHNPEKGKYIKMIESMREKLQKEEEQLREDAEEEEKRNSQSKDQQKTGEEAQEFDMFCETPEPVQTDNVKAPTAAADNQNYDDESGYYRGQIGEVINNRYKILAKLGKGVFGNVFKGLDTTNDQEVAIKIIRSEEIYSISGLKEREILILLNEADRHNKRHVIRQLDSFEYRKHLILVFELMEMDLRSAIKTFGKKVGLSIESVRSYARQLFISLAHLRKHKIIHADLKPDNILVTNNKKTLKLSDFGSAFPVEENTITPYLVARYYRAPEIMLGCPYDTAVDMWSAACTIFELYTGKILFSGRDNNEMLKVILQTKGKFNNKMLKRGEFSAQYFDKQNNFLSLEIDPVTKEKYTKPIPIGHKITRDIGVLLNAVEVELTEEDQKKVAQLKDLLERCLTLDPKGRMSPEEALKHQFINYDMQKFTVDQKTLKHAF